MSELTRSSSQKVEERIQRIVEVIKAEEQRLRTQHPILQYQNLLGMSILVLSFLGMLGLGLLYFYEVNNVISNNYNKGTGYNPKGYS